MLVLLVSPARACPVCGSNRETSRPTTSSRAILAATGSMLILPLAMAGGFALWVRRRTK
jgi:hypothetical protein